MCVKRTVVPGVEEGSCCSVEPPSCCAWCGFNWSGIDYLQFMINPKWVCLYWLRPSSAFCSVCPLPQSFADLSFASFMIWVTDRHLNKWVVTVVIFIGATVMSTQISAGEITFKKVQMLCSCVNNGCLWLVLSHTYMGRFGCWIKVSSPFLKHR